MKRQAKQKINYHSRQISAHRRHMDGQPQPGDRLAEPEIHTLIADNAEEFENEDEDEDEDEDDDDFAEKKGVEPEAMTPEDQSLTEKAERENLILPISADRVPLRVNDVIVNGNTKIKDYLIVTEVEAILRDATNFEELLSSCNVAIERLRHLNAFDSVIIALDAGPPELSGTVNVTINVSEAKSPVSQNFGSFLNLEDRSWSLGGMLKLNFFFGYGDAWEGSVAPEQGQALSLTAGLSLPKFKAFGLPLSARVSLLSQDLLKFSSYREPIFGLTLGLLSTAHHDVSCILSGCKLNNQIQEPYDTPQRWFGRTCFSGLKYSYTIGQMDSLMRPSQGHTFVSTTHIGGILPYIKSSHLISQEFDLRYAIPMGFYRAALNLGFSCGFVFPWKNGYLNQRSLIGDISSQLFSFGGPASALGFKAWGFDTRQPRSVVKTSSNDESTDNSGADNIGGDIALKALADISFDLPFTFLRETGIHGHIFACTGSLNRLTQNTYREFSFHKLLDSFRSYIGFGIIIPTKLMRVEANCCYVLKREIGRGKAGLQFKFSSS